MGIHTRLLVLALLAAISTTACSSAVPNASSPSTSAASAGKTVAPAAKGTAKDYLPIAEAAAKAQATDARLMSVSTVGVFMRMPPGEWSYGFISASKSALITVRVHEGKAGAAQMTASPKVVAAIKLADASQWRVNTDEVLSKAGAWYEKTYGQQAPLALAVTLNFADLSATDLKTAAPRAWRVTYYPDGKSRHNGRSVDIDSKTGALTPAPTK